MKQTWFMTRLEIAGLAVVGLAAAVAVSGGISAAQLPLPLSSAIGVREPAPAAARRPAIGEPQSAVRPPVATLLSVDLIWDRAPYNSFTDLIRFRGRWYCVFREGSAHVSPDGAIRLISSSDGVHWESAFHAATPYADLRDPKLSITPDNRLMLSAVAAYNPPRKIGHQTLAWYSLDGRNWGVPFKIGDPEYWLWRIRWHEGSAYSVAYHTVPPSDIRMYVGPEGLRFQVVADKLVTTGSPNEATLLFNRDDSALCLLRRDGHPATALLGYSRPPYRGWKWRDLGVRIGGPDMIRLPDGRIVAAGRLFNGGAHTGLCWLDPEQATLQEFLRLPSGGDNSYPGLVFYQGILWVSYYSSHAGKASIYLARVQLPAKEEKKPNAKPKLTF